MRIRSKLFLDAMMLVCLAALLLTVGSPAAPEYPRIVFDPGAGTYRLRLTNNELPERVASTAQHWPATLGDTSVRQFLPPTRIVRVRVVRYSAERFKSPLEVEIILKKLWQSTAEAPSASIDWAEYTLWAIDAFIEFNGGKRTRLVTDGFHHYVQSENGDIWFFRTRTTAARS
jgi:hypothetical protein